MKEEKKNIETELEKVYREENEHNPLQEKLSIFESFLEKIVNFIVQRINVFIFLTRLHKQISKISEDIADYFYVRLTNFKDNKKHRSAFYRLLIIFAFLLMLLAAIWPFAKNSIPAIREVSSPLVYIALCLWLLSLAVKRKDNTRSRIYKILVVIIFLLLLAAILIPIITNSKIAIPIASFILTCVALFVWIVSAYVKRND